MTQRTLIIADIHTNHVWIEPAIAALAPAKVVFLGDYFDGKTGRKRVDVEAQRSTAEWLRHSLDQPNRIHLLGNHDVHYAFRGNQCSGYDEFSHATITSTLGQDWGERLRLHHWEQGRLLTHAGVHPALWPGTVEAFNKLCEDAMDALRHNRWNALLNCGEERGGDGVSGLLWSDFRWSFEAIPGLPQIVGHTPHPEPVCIRSEEGTENWNLDTDCAWLGRLENGQFLIIKNTFTPGF